MNENIRYDFIKSEHFTENGNLSSSKIYFDAILLLKFLFYCLNSNYINI